MKIFIRGLPSDTSPMSLRKFAEALLKPPWYLPMRQRIGIKSCVVLKIKDLERKAVEFHGMLEVTPYKHALDAIERLNREEFNGRLLQARKWHDRTSLKDRRNPYGHDETTLENDRRSRDRRRRRLVVETYEPPRFKGLSQYHREFG